MKNTNEGSDRLTFIGIVRFFWKWKWPLIIITLLSGVIAFILASPPFTYPKYKSTVIFYPATASSVSGAILGEQRGEQTDFLSFGEDEEAEQLLQVLQSTQIRNHIKEKYNLMNHYDIDPEGNYPEHQFAEKFNDNVSFDKTQFMSIRVSVLDENPEMAANIANDIVDWMDSVKTFVQRDRAKAAFKIVEREYMKKEEHLHKMTDSLRVLGRMGVLNYEEQAGALSKALADARLSRNAEVTAELREQIKALGEYGPVQHALSERLIFELEDLTDLRQKYEQLKVDAQQSLSHKFIIDEAVPAEKKSYPLRAVIVILTMLSTFILMSILLAFYENLKLIRSSLS